MKGTLQQQDATAFSVEKIAGQFAFKLESNPTERVATVGRFAIAANANISGLADSSESGAGPMSTSAAVVGRITSAPDATGRGTLSLANGGETSQLVYYIVSSKALMMMETTSGTPGGNRQVGLAELQVLRSRRPPSMPPATFTLQALTRNRSRSRACDGHRQTFDCPFLARDN